MHAHSTKQRSDTAKACMRTAPTGLHGEPPGARCRTAPEICVMPRKYVHAFLLLPAIIFPLRFAKCRCRCSFPEKQYEDTGITIGSYSSWHVKIGRCSIPVHTHEHGLGLMSLLAGRPCLRPAGHSVDTPQTFRKFTCDSSPLLGPYVEQLGS